MNPALTRIDLPGLPHLRSGKVREVFDLDDRLLFVASDRISAFDCILPNGIPGKGCILNQLSAWWFGRLAGLAPNHLVTARVDEFPEDLRPFREVLAGRAMIVRKAEMLPVECVVRGYLAGSGWKEYQAGGTVCGVPLRAGYRLADRLDEPIFTPATKAESGHDINISFEAMQERVGADLAGQARSLALALYAAAAAHARSCGILVADTKFEFGVVDGRLVLADEVLTPDSSRFWPADTYRPGSPPPSYDKQYVRDYLESLDWDKTPPAPALPPEVVRRSAEKYREAFRRLTGAEPAG